MNTFQLTCFLAVAETLNFARAAEHLHVTQPAVTQQIHSLEKELNAKLFKRTTRTVRLTEAGLVFLGDARRIVALSERAKKRFENPYGMAIQTLSIGCYSYAQLFLLPPMLKQLAAQYPDVHPRLQVVPGQHLYRLLEEEDVEAVIGFREPSFKKISANYREIAKVPVVCICPFENPLSRKQAVALDELKGEKLVLFDPAKAQEDSARLQGRLMEGRAPSAFYFCESAEAVIILVESGLGISILPDLFIPPDLSLARIPIQGVEPVSFGIYYKSVQGNAPLKELIRIMKESVAPETAAKPGEPAATLQPPPG